MDSRATKIVATCGPATDPDGMIDQLLTAGVNVFRMNASHGTAAERIARIRKIREVSASRRVHSAILLDLQGPKIRLGKFEGGKADLVTGSRFTITTQPLLGNASIASTVYENFAKDVRPGDRVLLVILAVVLYFLLLVSYPWHTLTASVAAYLLFLPFSVRAYSKRAAKEGEADLPPDVDSAS